MTKEVFLFQNLISNFEKQVSPFSFALQIKTHCCMSVNLLANLSLSLRNYILGEVIIGVVACQTTYSRAFLFPKCVLSTIRPPAECQEPTAVWVVCLVSPAAALKIKGNNQQITQRFTHSLLFVRFYVPDGWWWGLVLHYGAVHLALLAGM